MCSPVSSPGGTSPPMLHDLYAFFQCDPRWHCLSSSSLSASSTKLCIFSVTLFAFAISYASTSFFLCPPSSSLHFNSTFCCGLCFLCIRLTILIELIISHRKQLAGCQGRGVQPCPCYSCQSFTLCSVLRTGTTTVATSSALGTGSTLPYVVKI